MPEATSGLKAEMMRRFGSLDAAGPRAALEKSGYTLTPETTWRKDGVTDLGGVAHEDFNCILFLHQHWNFRGLAVPATD